jgi:thiamine-monophosphate kinase
VNPRLGAGPEFDRIRAIATALGDRAAGLGDDCALLDLGNEHLALSSDISIEGTHFRREWLAPAEIGWRAAAGALSDLAAVGAEPIGLLASLALPADSSPALFTSLMEGVGRAVDSVGGKVLGGDLSRSPLFTVDITVIGRTTGPILRSGARAGDGVWVTGSLGAARAALLALLSGRPADPAAREAFAHPTPRVAAGRWLARNGASAMIDLSDGLAGDAGHLAAASNVAIGIELERIPLGAGVPEAALAAGESSALLAARGGEDYELLIALPEGFSTKQAAACEAESGTPLTRIGTVTSGEGVELTLKGKRVQLRGFDHFA